MLCGVVSGTVFSGENCTHAKSRCLQSPSKIHRQETQTLSLENLRNMCLVQTCQYKNSYELVVHLATMIGLSDAHHLQDGRRHSEFRKSDGKSDRGGERSLSIPRYVQQQLLVIGPPDGERRVHS